MTDTLDATELHDNHWGMDTVKVLKLHGANMDIDLASDKKKIPWRQDACPWNKASGTSAHKCAVKNTSLCPYFYGIEYVDTVLCCYPHKHPRKRNK